jgi:hypothetical protein
MTLPPTACSMHGVWHRGGDFSLCGFCTLFLAERFACSLLVLWRDAVHCLHSVSLLVAGDDTVVDAGNGSSVSGHCHRATAIREHESR